MTIKIDAIFEHGVFRPTGPVAVAEGERVQLIIASPDTQMDAGAVAKTLAAIAALPLETTDDEMTARDHDRFLYGTEEP